MHGLKLQGLSRSDVQSTATATTQSYCGRRTHSQLPRGPDRVFSETEMSTYREPLSELHLLPKV